MGARGVRDPDTLQIFTSPDKRTAAQERGYAAALTDIGREQVSAGWARDAAAGRLETAVPHEMHRGERIAKSLSGRGLYQPQHVIERPTGRGEFAELLEAIHKFSEAMGGEAT